MNLIVDASVIAKWFLEDEVRADKALDLLDALVFGQATLAAPDLALYEVGHTLLRRMGEVAASERLLRLAAISISWVAPDRDMLVLTTEMAADHDLSFYDASYLACALRYRTPLVSDDRALVNAAMDEGFGIALERLQLPADG